ncbi:hypothetical protein NBRC116188_19900 [Oceaniserpentilla sp. 4NH20-0058]|uniref:hypothetical protein n=1 Tax=Oceaniserpentilla sp. 4NH20-0058 TaxID=3127660 RepID=UPI00310A68CB
MVEVISGHLGNGRWRFKEVDNVIIFTLIQAFNRHDEFRIGPDQILGYEIEQTLEDKVLVKINFSDLRYCRCYISNSDLHHLDTMVISQAKAPEYKANNDPWINGLIAFFAACIVYQFFK